MNHNLKPSSFPPPSSFLAAKQTTYIVHMNHNLKPSSFPSHRHWYSATLNSLTTTSSDSDSDSDSLLLYTYTTAYHGFAASLTPSQAESLLRSDSVLGVYQDTLYSLHTTRTPKFLGLVPQLGLWAGHTPLQLNQASQEVVVGVLDTGVWPESKSFDDSLTPSQAESLRRSDSVLSVYQDTLYSLHTTRTTEFLGLDPQLGLWPSHTSLQLNQASQEVVVGVLDTGVWPESKSFDNSGMLDKWKGECESGPDFKPTLRNKKLIGARRFSSEREFTRLRDYDGHGTHTSSTAAGAHVANASLLGYASGTARGMAINARLAAHKICWKTGCFGSDILAGMDRAILVDVLSLSLGCGSAPSYRDTIAIGAFTATEKGIFVSWSAGNSGPGKGSLANVAPWIMTVGAGTIDRDFPAYAVMGDSKRFTGVSLYSGKGMGKKPVGLVYSTGKNSSSNLCLRGSLEPDVVRGKLVLCDRGINARVEKGLVVRDAGGVGMILANAAASGEELVADSHLLPAVAVGRKVGDLIRDYVRKDEATAVLSFDGKVLNVRPSPVVAAFSSRGPNMVTQQVLKPDVIGPGVNILAGWSEAVGPTGLDQDTRKTQFNIMSGVEIEAVEKKIPANENELTFVPETNSFGQNFRPSEGIGVSGRACCGCRHPCSCNPCYCTVSLSAPRVMPSEGSEKSTEAEREGILPKTRACSFWGFWIWNFNL